MSVISKQMEIGHVMLGYVMLGHVMLDYLMLAAALHTSFEYSRQSVLPK